MRAMTICAALLAGCATGSTVTVMPSAVSQATSPKTPDQIRIFTTEPEKGTYLPVAVLQATQTQFMPDSADEVLGKMIARAGELGCDGLVLEPQDQLFGFSGNRVTSGPFWQQLPDEAIVDETRFGSGRLADAKGNGGAAGLPEHWTLEGYRAECVVLR